MTRAKSRTTKKVPETEKVTKQIRVTLAKDDADFVSKIAKTLGISETEVLRKGVKLMNLYAEAYGDPNAKMILEKSDTKQELFIL